MNRFDRITHILIQLQYRRLITARELADRFELSIRTIYRDIKSLREAGVPIGEEEGKGYFLVDGYRLPPIMFSPEEANALLAVGKILETQAEESLKANYRSALLKIRSVLDSEQKEKLEFLESRTAIPKPWAASSQFLEAIQHAMTESRLLEIGYHSRLKDEESLRKIAPHALYFTGVNWLVVAFCHLRNDFREFRLDRIKSLRLRSENFSPDPKFNLQEYLRKRAEKPWNP